MKLSKMKAVLNGQLQQIVQENLKLAAAQAIETTTANDLNGGSEWRKGTQINWQEPSRAFFNTNFRSFFAGNFPLYSLLQYCSTACTCFRNNDQFFWP